MLNTTNYLSGEQGIPRVCAIGAALQDAFWYAREAANPKQDGMFTDTKRHACLMRAYRALKQVIPPGRAGVRYGLRYPRRMSDAEGLVIVAVAYGRYAQVDASTGLPVPKR